MLQVLRNSTDYQRLVDELVTVRCSDFSLKYQILNVKELFLQNSQTNEGIEMLVTALGILHKYANNLLKQELERPVRWREIYLLNPTFSHKVDVVQGTRDILERLGYKLVPPDKMAFPLGKEPDRELVARVTADILLGKADLQSFLRRQHPQQQQFAQFLRHRSHICGSSSHWTEADLDNQLPISKIPRPGIESSPMSAPGTVSSPMSAPGIISHKNSVICHLEESIPPSNSSYTSTTVTHCQLPAEGAVKGGAAPCCSTPSDVASGAGTLGVVASGAGTLGVVASGAGTLGVVASGAGTLGGVASGGGTLGVVANGAGTLDVIESGAGTLGSVASGVGTLGGVASGGGTLGGVASGGGTLGGVASGGGTLGGVASGGGTLGGVASGGGTLGGVASGGGTLGDVASGGGTLGGVASGGGTLGGRPLMSCLADIHRQKEEEKKKQEALKKARVDVPKLELCNQCRGTRGRVEVMKDACCRALQFDELHLHSFRRTVDFHLE
ncbi:hypothetical protein LSAT2_003928 [Lamellibrachia satsuma]|nr:hypothetical protein LSAT2_003928 [Lamellibrachia satsuma]